MYLNDYGMIHVLHWLRAKETERQQPNIADSVRDAAPRTDGLIKRVQRWLLHSQPVPMTGAKPAHLHG